MAVLTAMAAVVTGVAVAVRGREAVATAQEEEERVVGWTAAAAWVVVAWAAVA